MNKSMAKIRFHWKIHKNKGQDSLGYLEFTPKTTESEEGAEESEKRKLFPIYLPGPIDLLRGESLLDTYSMGTGEKKGQPFINWSISHCK